jgi:hypothetical protein
MVRTAILSVRCWIGMMDWESTTSRCRHVVDERGWIHVLIMERRIWVIRGMNIRGRS